MIQPLMEWVMFSGLYRSMWIWDRQGRDKECGVQAGRTELWAVFASLAAKGKVVWRLLLPSPY